MCNRAFLSQYIYIGILSILLFLFILPAKGQYTPENQERKPDFKSRLFFGGGLGLQFGSATLIEISPLVGYMVTPKLGIGLSPTYKYYHYNNYYGPSYDLETNVFGGSIFARYSIFQNIFAHVEYESLFYNTSTPIYPSYREQFNSFFIGGGYMQNFSQNSGMYIMVLWNLNDTPNSPYINPVIRVGFNVGM
jgi:hypothetical protein